MTPEEFDREVYRHRPRFIRIANRVIKNHDDAEDIVQETLVDAWLKITNGAITIRSFPSYVGKMCEFRARRTLWLRKSKKFSEVPMEDWITEADENSCSTYTPEVMVVQACVGRQAQRDALRLADQARLTNKQVTRFWQRYWYGMTDQQIADHEGVAQQSVNTGIRSALLALQRAATAARPPPP